MGSGSGEGQAEIKSCHCLCTQHGKNSDEKDLKTLDTRATRNDPALKNKPCNRSHHLSKFIREKTEEVTCVLCQCWVFNFANKVITSCLGQGPRVAGQYGECLSNMADCWVFLIPGNISVCDQRGILTWYRGECICKVSVKISSLIHLKHLNKYCKRKSPWEKKIIMSSEQVLNSIQCKGPRTE